MSPSPIHSQAETVRRLIEERLRIKAPTLEKALAKAGRLLPKSAQKNGAILVQAATHAQHPKLRLTVDPAKATKAHDALVAHLKTIDPAERRKTQILGLLGVVSFNLILVVAAFIGFLVWRGYV